jgi:hypothetical protein
MNKTYSVIGNRTAADVVKRNDEVIATGIADIEEARRVAINAQKFEGFIAAWVEAEPRIVERIERDVVSGVAYKAVYCDGWSI